MIIKTTDTIKEIVNNIDTIVETRTPSIGDAGELFELDDVTNTLISTDGKSCTIYDDDYHYYAPDGDETRISTEISRFKAHSAAFAVDANTTIYTRR